MIGAGSRRRASPVTDEDIFEDAVEELEEEPRSGEQAPRKRPGKEPAVEAEDHPQPQQKEDHRPLDEGEGEEEEEDEAAPGPSSKKRRKPGPNVVPKRARRAGPSQASRAPANATEQQRAATADDGEDPIVLPNDEFFKVEQIVQQYTMAADIQATRLSSGTGITVQGLDALTRKVVRHMIFRNTEHPGVPVPRADLTKLISGTSTGGKKQGLPGYVIALAQQKTLQCFGLEMKELTKGRGAQAGGSAADGSKHFVLRSVVPLALHSAVVRDRDGDAAQGLTSVVLALVDLAGGKISSDELWRHLGDVGVHADRDHPLLGRPSQLLDDLVKRRYLNKDRVAGQDGEEVTFSMAENAADEVGPAQVKQWYEAEFAASGNGNA